MSLHVVPVTSPSQAHGSVGFPPSISLPPLPSFPPSLPPAQSLTKLTLSLISPISYPTNTNVVTLFPPSDANHSNGSHQHPIPPEGCVGN